LHFLPGAFLLNVINYLTGMELLISLFLSPVFTIAATFSDQAFFVTQFLFFDSAKAENACLFLIHCSPWDGLSDYFSSTPQ